MSSFTICLAEPSAHYSSQLNGSHCKCWSRRQFSLCSLSEYCAPCWAIVFASPSGSHVPSTRLLQRPQAKEEALSEAAWWAHCRRCFLLPKLPISGTESRFCGNVSLHHCLLIAYCYCREREWWEMTIDHSLLKETREDNGHFNTVCCHLLLSFQCPFHVLSCAAFSLRVSYCFFYTFFAVFQPAL